MDLDQKPNVSASAISAKFRGIKTRHDIMFIFASTVLHPDRVWTVGRSDIMFMFASTRSHLDRV